MFNYTRYSEDQVIFHDICMLQELQNGERIFVEIDRNPIVIFNIADSLFAIGDVCSHDNGPLGDGEIREGAVACPRHGAKFDIANGQVLSLPAVEDIPAYPVRIANDRVQVGIPK